MTPKTETECKSFIWRYKEDSAFIPEHRKIQIRNKLYYIMSADIQMWIKSILKKWGRHEDSDEIISISFDAFLFCLKQYKEGFEGLSGFFYKAIRYFLLMKYIKEEREKMDWIPFEELKEIFPTDLQYNRKKIIY